jgi:predicted metal-dependent HD superfamily phosphohydrolase
MVSFSQILERLRGLRDSPDLHHYPETLLSHPHARKRQLKLGWPQAEIRDSEIYIVSYPFHHASVFPGRVSLPASRITAIFDSVSDAAVIADGKEVIFLPDSAKASLDSFALRNNIPCPQVGEAWAHVAQPYIDQPYTPDQERQDFRWLDAQGVRREEVRALRVQIAETMRAATWFSWEWLCYTTQDVLRSIALLHPERLSSAFYWRAMEIAVRPYAPVDFGEAQRIPGLRPHWDAAWQDLAIEPPPAAALNELLGRHLQPHRRFHSLRHLEECFASFAPMRSETEHPGEVQLALWFHDATYFPRRKDNEESSARFAEQVLRKAGAAPETLQRIRELILATRHDAVPHTQDARVLVDVDLSILGAASERFDEYETQLRAEYAHVPDVVFRVGHARILKQMLARPSIYCTAQFKSLLEAQARKNIERALARLS